MTTTSVDNLLPAGFIDVSLSQLRESPMNARRNFNAEKLKELAESIRQKGVLTPLLVRSRHYELTSKAAIDPEMTYEILAGARRFRASKIAGLHVVPCIVRDLDDTAALEIITMENLQREDLSALEEAQGFKALLDLGKYDVPELAKRLGKSVSYVYQRVKLADLAPEAKKALLDEKITAGHAILLARLQPDDQKHALKECVPDRFGDSLSVRELTEFIKQEIYLDLTKAPWKLDDATLLPADRATSCNACPKREKNNCLDPACHEAKMRAHFARIEETSGATRVVRISARPGDLKDGVYQMYAWRAAKPRSCASVVTGLPVDSGYAMDREIHPGQAISICIDKACKVHWSKPAREESPYKRPAAWLARERKERALQEARVEALRQIVAKGRSVEMQDITSVLARRTSFDAQKLACKILGIWPKDGKVGDFDFRKKLQEQIRKVKSCSGILTALVHVSDMGRWGLEYYYGRQDLAALHKAGKTAGVNVERLELQAVAAATAKAKPAKSQTSAKSARKAKGKK